MVRPILANELHGFMDAPMPHIDVGPIYHTNMVGSGSFDPYKRMEAGEYKWAAYKNNLALDLLSTKRTPDFGEQFDAVKEFKLEHHITDPEPEIFAGPSKHLLPDTGGFNLPGPMPAPMHFREKALMGLEKTDHGMRYASSIKTAEAREGILARAREGSLFGYEPGEINKRFNDYHDNLIAQSIRKPNREVFLPKKTEQDFFPGQIGGLEMETLALSGLKHPAAAMLKKEYHTHGNIPHFQVMGIDGEERTTHAIRIGEWNTNSSSKNKTDYKGLAKVLSGAAIGFAIAGPIGGIIGALIGEKK